MDFREIFDTYKELKEILSLKKNAVIKKNIEELSKLDEECLVICEKMKKPDFNEALNTLSDGQKAELKKLGEEIRQIEENNEILINHSLNVINGTLSGILNIVKADKCSYNAKGKPQDDTDSVDMSSITEEA